MIVTNKSNRKFLQHFVQCFIQAHNALNIKMLLNKSYSMYKIQPEFMYRCIYIAFLC